MNLDRCVITESRGRAGVVAAVVHGGLGDEQVAQSLRRISFQAGNAFGDLAAATDEIVDWLKGNKLKRILKSALKLL
jgi:hypothetical protein